LALLGDFLASVAFFPDLALAGATWGLCLPLLPFFAGLPLGYVVYTLWQKLVKRLFLTFCLPSWATGVMNRHARTISRRQKGETTP
jgi:hypothetical protein